MLALVAFLAVTTQFGPPTLQPTTYTSPSGEWRLSVDPSSMLGAGPAQVAVTHKGERAWERRADFTFWSALISDSGYVAGYGFSTGWSDMADDGDVVVAIHGPDGKTLLEERVKRTWSNFLHCPPNPNPDGLFLHPQLDLFVLRVGDPDINAADEQWWTYRLSSGEKLGLVHPKHTLASPEVLRSAIAVRPILGTPLTLAQWYHFNWQAKGGRELGTRFVLVGADWKPVWTLELPKDYRVADDDAETRLLHDMWERGGILAADAPRRFELRHVAEKLRVTYEVTADPAVELGWTVREVARAPYVEAVAASEAAPAELPVLALRKVASVPLQVGPPVQTGPIRDIEAFDFDAKGNVRFVRSEREKLEFTVVQLDAAGVATRETRIAPIAPEFEGHRRWDPLVGDDWLFTISPLGESVTSRAWRIDGASGRSVEFEDFNGPSVDAVAAARDGGFVVLGTWWWKYTMSEALTCFDASGEVRWTLDESSDTDDPASLFASEDVAVAPDGSILVLDNIRHVVQFFRADGVFERAIELEQAWGGDDMYPTDVLVEPAGTLIVHDFHDVRTWHRLDRGGRELASFVPRRETGNTDVGESSDVRIDSSGRIWGTDGQELYVFSADGVVQTRFGSAPAAHFLSKVEGVLLDGRGRIALEDARTHALHVFAASGARELVLEPGPTDFDRGDSVDDLVVAPDGRFFVQPSTYKDRYLEFAPDGKRIGWTELGGERVAFTAGTGERWGASGSEYDATFVRRIGGDGGMLKQIERRPGNDFLVEVLAIGAAPDGSVAVLARGPELCFYSSTAEPQRTINLAAAPRGWWKHLDHGRRWVVVSSYTNEAVLVSLAQGRAFLVRVSDGAEGTTHAFGLSPDESELWCATLTPPALHRFALPQ